MNEICWFKGILQIPTDHLSLFLPSLSLSLTLFKCQFSTVSPFLCLSFGVYSLACLPFSLSLFWYLFSCLFLSLCVCLVYLSLFLPLSHVVSLHLSLFLALTWCLFTFQFFFLPIFSLSLTVSASYQSLVLLSSCLSSTSYL